jgi:hypothetical protein
MHNKILQQAKDWQKRSKQENLTINFKWLSQFVVSSKRINLNMNPWVFSNIPKTAGRALDNYLTQAFALADILHLDSEYLRQLPQSIYLKNQYPKAITGQFDTSDLLYQLLPNQEIVHLSMMREPIYRVVFLYNNLATQAYHIKGQNGKPMDFDSFIQQKHNTEIQNGQARRFAGELSKDSTITDQELYIKAKEVVDNCFSLVGIAEQFEDFYQLLGKMCGIRFHNLPPIVRSRLKVQLSDISDEHLSIIKKRNRVDIQLYEYVKSQFNDKIKQ